MKIGIITKHSVPNYGAMLQAYALAKAISTLGHDVELVDYDQPATTEYFKPSFTFPPRINNLLRYYRCKKFVKNHQPTSSEHCTEIPEFQKFLAKYDVLFTGSDQVWFTGPVQYYDPMYFLDFEFPNGIKASYAPSAGGLESFAEFEQKVKHALNNFDHISIRDDNTARLASELTDKPLTRVCDPTFLHDFDDLTSSTPPLNKPYFLLFGNIPNNRIATIKKHAASKNIQHIVSLQYRNDDLATDRIAAPDPITWLNYIKHADFVYTSYFHGAVFSTKFHREFIAIPTKGRIKKVSTVLQDCGLSHRRVIDETSNQEMESMTNTNIDWPETDRLKAEFIKRSVAYIETVIESANKR
ncbi:Polysaccharide pyruvyl transferase [Alteromonadaceae bacterium Bs31]|nr:Polysaccharide pyruvyl transferase [Alteromonadaceae bacterium Bs31]